MPRVLVPVLLPCWPATHTPCAALPLAVDGRKLMWGGARNSCSSMGKGQRGTQGSQAGPSGARSGKGKGKGVSTGALCS